MIHPLAAGERVTARHLCDVSLEHADALAALSMKDEADDWKIDGFYVQPFGADRR